GSDADRVPDGVRPAGNVVGRDRASPPSAPISMDSMCTPVVFAGAVGPEQREAHSFGDGQVDAARDELVAGHGLSPPGCEGVTGLARWAAAGDDAAGAGPGPATGNDRIPRRTLAGGCRRPAEDQPPAAVPSRAREAHRPTRPGPNLPSHLGAG